MSASGEETDRTGADGWDPSSGVGATATMVATARALASMRPDALINDPFAEALVRAVGLGYFTGLIDQIRCQAAGDFDASSMVDQLALRTRFYDEVFLDAAATGILQAVIWARDWTPALTGCRGRPA